MKDVTRQHHYVRRRRDDPVDGASKRRGHVCFPLVDPLGCLAAILPEPEMEVGQVGEFHRSGSDS
jgi:hypothetical protein